MTGSLDQADMNMSSQNLKFRKFRCVHTVFRLCYSIRSTFTTFPFDFFLHVSSFFRFLFLLFCVCTTSQTSPEAKQLLAVESVASSERATTSMKTIFEKETLGNYVG